MPETANPDHQLTSLLIRTMALLCVRNTMIEDIHAGLVPVTRTGDYSDVTVIDADGRRIPWTEVSHFDDETMRAPMRQVVDRLYTYPDESRRTGIPGANRPLDGCREPLGRTEARRVLPAAVRREGEFMTDYHHHGCGAPVCVCPTSRPDRGYSLPDSRDLRRTRRAPVVGRNRPHGPKYGRRGSNG